MVLTLGEIQQQQTILAQQGRQEQPDDLWNELLGLLKVQGPDLDLSLIEQQASQLHLLTSTQQALTDAGLQEAY